MPLTQSSVPVPRPRRPTLAFGSFRFDPDNQLLTSGESHIPAPPRVLGVLDLLLERAGDVVSRQELIDRVWKDAFVTDTSLAEAVSVLRQTLGDDPQAPTYIQTVHRRGYRFVAPLSTVERTVRADPPPPADVPLAVSPSIGGQLIPWTIALLCGVLAAVAVVQLLSREEPASVPVRFELGLPDGQTFDSRRGPVALSPDGRTAAWSACTAEGCALYARKLGDVASSPVAGTRGARSPFFSPDGQSLAFFADEKLMRVSLSGGSPAAIADVSTPRGGVWTTGGRIIFGSGLAGGLSQVSDAGGAVSALTSPRQDDGEVRHGWPSLSPDGRTLFFLVGTSVDDAAPARLAAAALRDREGVTGWSTVLGGIGLAQPMARDLLILSRGTELQAVQFDPLRRVAVGVPQTLASTGTSLGGTAPFATAPPGVLLYPTSGTTAPPESTLRWSAAPDRTPVPRLRLAGAPALSPDGTRIVWAGPGDGQTSDIRVADLARGTVTRLTHDGINESPVWSPDSRRVYFARSDGHRFQLASVDADAGAIVPGPPTPGHAFPGSVSADGRLLAFTTPGAGTRSDIWLTDIATGHTAQAVVGGFDDGYPALSPDGTCLAYQSDEGGRTDVYVRRLRDGRRVVVTAAGGERPFWSRDGRTLLYMSAGAVMRAPVDVDSLSVGPASQVLDATELEGGLVLGAAADGRLLLLDRAVGTARTAVIASHWEEEVRRLLGPPTAAMPR